MSTSFQTTTGLASPSGAALRLYSTHPSGKVRGVVQVNHGLAEHAARYGRFAAFLAAQGWHVYAHDHRGHGATRAPDAPARMFAAEHGADKVLADVAAVHAHIAERHPGLPVILFGHSMGGLIALNFLLRHRPSIAGAAIWNANFSAGLLGKLGQAILWWEKLRLGSDVPSRILPKLTFADWAKKVPGARTPFDWLSRDPAEVDAYIADPLCGWDATVSMWRDVFDFIFYGADDANFGNIQKSLPVHLQGGEHDPATNGGKAVQDLANRMRAMGFSNVTLSILAQTRHESLNEVNRDAIMADFAHWAERAAG